jgi:DNA modification methylase
MSKYIYKTIYFPKNRVKSKTATRINISLPSKNKGSYPSEFINYIESISSKNFRLAIQDPFLEDLEKLAEDDNRSLSNTCLTLLLSSFDNQAIFNNSSDSKRKGVGITFSDSKRKGIFGWYPYVEGFDANYIRDIILRDNPTPKSIYDPFGGSGTVQLACSFLNIPSFYSELNPFMAFVAETKIKSSLWARKNLKITERILNSFIETVKDGHVIDNAHRTDLANYHIAFPDRNFFEEKDIKELLCAIDLAKNIASDYKHLENILILACVSNAVGLSNMTRRADLRRRRDNEYKNRVVNVTQTVQDTAKRFLNDILETKLKNSEMTKVSSDSKEPIPEYQNSMDLVLTSPPYLNGTNYFRNTKLELWLMSFIITEKDLSGFRKKTVTGGINDVYKENSILEFPFVESVAKQLDISARDKRIPTMIRHYFSDMYEVMKNSFNMLKPGKNLILDIGDSKFYGTHVPTDLLLIKVGERLGFIFKERNILARRLSKDKSELVQVELIFTKPLNVKVQTIDLEASLSERINAFQRTMPFKSLPYSKKSWGHKLHSLCSYQGKLKPAMAYWLIKTFTKKDSVICDPLGGVGTIPFEGALAGCKVITNDKSPFAATIASAKLNPPKIEEFEKEVARLKRAIKKVSLTKDDILTADFGLNSPIKEYFHENTLTEILKLRKLYNSTSFKGKGTVELFFWSCLLHVLHGNRPYALSRSSHSITPFKPTGITEYKSVFQKVKEKAIRTLDQELPSTFIKGQAYNLDFRELPKVIESKVDCIITSPPFYGMRFDRPNWMRLWFCGWSEKDFKETSTSFLERQQVKNVNVYMEFFETCKSLLNENGLLVIHLGAGGKKDLHLEFKALIPKCFQFIGEVIEDVQSVNKHGLVDKGFTKKQTLQFYTFNP